MLPVTTATPGDAAGCHDDTTAQGCSISTHVAWGNPGVTGAAHRWCIGTLVAWGQPSGILAARSKGHPQPQLSTRQPQPPLPYYLPPGRQALSDSGQITAQGGETWDIHILSQPACAPCGQGKVFWEEFWEQQLLAQPQRVSSKQCSLVPTNLR